MDLIGEIVERKPAQANAPVIENASKLTGFPKLEKIDFRAKKSRFRSTAKKAPKVVEPEPEVSEAQRIHQENMDKISLLTIDEISAEKEELLASLDPKLLQTLLQRTEARQNSDSAHSHHVHAEGHDGWIGGGRDGSSMPKLDDADVKRALGVKTVQFAEEDNKIFPATEETVIESNVAEAGDEDDDEIAPEGYQIIEEEPAPQEFNVHFPKPKTATEDPDLDLNDPKFFDQLHEKYFPDFPKETSKLAWMTTPMPKRKINVYESISDMRFDFKGNLVELDDKSQDVPTYMGLHHHSDNPQLAGYTIPELVHFSRSVVPTQRCLGIQVLGRILHKLGLHKYNIIPMSANDQEDDNSEFAEEVKEFRNQFEDLVWDLLDQVRAIDSITEASDETKTKNLSVRNYALEALWLWKQGGGRLWREAKTEEEKLFEQMQKEQFCE